MLGLTDALICELTQLLCRSCMYRRQEAPEYAAFKWRFTSCRRELFMALFGFKSLMITSDCVRVMKRPLKCFIPKISNHSTFSAQRRFKTQLQCTRCQRAS